MKAYVLSTGLVFALLAMAHIWRAVERGPRVATDPFFLFMTAAAAGFSVWAWRVFRTLPRS